MAPSARANTIVFPKSCIDELSAMTYVYGAYTRRKTAYVIDDMTPQLSLFTFAQ